MKFFHFLFALALLLFGFSSCDDNNEDPVDDSYQLFPDGFFSEGFREEYAISGLSESGATFSGTHLVLNEGTADANGVETIAVRTQNDWEDADKNSFTNGDISYFSTDESNRQLQFFETIGTGTLIIVADPEAIPAKAKIGDSGIVGKITDPNINTSTNSWKLEGSDNDLAKITFESEVRDASGTLISEGNISYVINKAGERQSVSIFFDLKDINDPVSWTGIKK